MNALIKTVLASAVAATVLTVGSAVAFKTMRTGEAAVPSNPTLLFADRFNDDGHQVAWDCMTHSWTVGSGSPETDEANGERQLTTGTIKDFVWAGCRNRTLDQITGATTATPTAQ